MSETRAAIHAAASVVQARRLADATRWSLSFAMVAAAHAALAFALLLRDPPSAATEAPEAAVLIDLPPELALPRAENVESVASAAAVEVPPETAAEDTPEQVPIELPPVEAAPAAASNEDVAALPPDEAMASEEATQDATEALPPEDAASLAALDEPVETEPVETRNAVPVEDEIALADAPEVATPDSADIATQDAAEVATQDVAEVATKEEAAETSPTETAETLEQPPPFLDVVPRPRPEPPRPRPREDRPRQVARAESKIEKPKQVRRTERTAERKRAAAKPARAAVAGRRASGAGAPDRNALSRFVSRVRADIMRQRQTVQAAGRGRTATVSFTVTASGRLSGIGLAKSSGDPRLDAAALAMVRRASPVPPIPADVGRSRIPTVLPVRFD